MNRHGSRAVVAIAAGFLALALCASSLACGNDAGQSNRAPRVTLLISGVFGDKGFFDFGAEGLREAAKTHGIVAREIAGASDVSALTDKFLEAARTSDLVFIMGFELYDLASSASKDFPGTQFVFVDDVIPQHPANLSCVDFVEKDGAFLAGVLAAAFMREKYPGKPPVAGFVGGMDIPVIRDFLSGFEQGVKAVSPEARVDTRFAGAFDRPEIGAQCAAELYDSGSLVVFCAAGGTGLGSIEEAARRSAYVIGVDTDQRPLAPGNVIASMIKNVRKPVVDIVGAWIDGKFKPGSVFTYSISNEGIGLAFGDPPFLVSDSVIAIVDEWAARLASGDYEVR